MWTKYKLEEDKIYSAKIANCRFFVKKLGKKWGIISSCEPVPEYNNIGLKAIESEPDSIDWDTYVADKSNTLLMLPALPDRPVVYRPENTFSILPGKSVDIIISIPLWVQLYNNSHKPENLIYETASTLMSNTWFGDPDNGVLCYSLKKQIEMHSDLSNLCIHEIACPVKVRNESLTKLTIERLSIPAEELNIYSGNDLLCTNEVQVRFKGEEQANDVNIKASVPGLVPELKMINSARMLPGKGILRKSFHFIKSVTQY